MRRRLFRVGLALVAAMAIFALPGFTQGRGHINGKGRAHIEVRDHDRVRGPNRVLFPRPHDLSNHPQGWDRGRKTGWGNCDVPPGLAKKFGCRGFVFRGDRHAHRGPVVPIR